jgi:hypothetical protein
MLQVTRLHKYSGAQICLHLYKWYNTYQDPDLYLLNVFVYVFDIYNTQIAADQFQEIGKKLVFQ